VVLTNVQGDAKPGLARSLLVAIALVTVAVAFWQRVGGHGLWGQRWYRLVYRALYIVGLRVWERRTPPSDLIELIEGPTALLPGRALDLGCGSGTDSFYLAQHGWDVTGIDMVPEALALARRRAAAAGVEVHFVLGDVTRVPEVVQGEFKLLFDFGCFHTLPPDQRAAYVDGVSAAAAPGATFLLYGFARPPRLAPIHAGISLDEVRRRFSGRWEIVSAEQTTAAAIKVARTRVDRSFELWRFQLRRLEPESMA
jgi:SAM-dependent methyltransferase